jgi:hypothetical protein
MSSLHNGHDHVGHPRGHDCTTECDEVFADYLDELPDTQVRKILGKERYVCYLRKQHNQ